MDFQSTETERSHHSVGAVQKTVVGLDTDEHAEVFARASDLGLTEAEYTERLKERSKRIAAGLATFRTSQIALYEDLAEGILKPYTEYEALPATDRKVVERAVDNFLELTGSKTRKESSMLFKMTKAVIYGLDFKTLSEKEKDRLRRQCSSYASVVAAAYAADIAHGDLPAWIAEKHGIERIRLGQTKSGQENDARMAALPAATSLFLSGVQHTYDTADCFSLNAETEGKQVLLFGTYRKGTIEVHGVTTNDKVFGAACSAHLLATDQSADENDEAE